MIALGGGNTRFFVVIVGIYIGVKMSISTTHQVRSHAEEQVTQQNKPHVVFYLFFFFICVYMFCLDLFDFSFVLLREGKYMELGG